MWSKDCAASPMHRRCRSMRSPTFTMSMVPMHRRYRQCNAVASPMHRRYIGEALAMRRDPSTPSTWTPSRRPLLKSKKCPAGRRNLYISSAP
eukprot:1676527-Pyramimonas_sp.AAC.1